MHRILNYLFGWDYVTWQDCLYKGIDKVRVLPNGKPYFLKYGSSSNFTYITKENNGSTVIHAWMTCDPGKYIGDK